LFYNIFQLHFFVNEYLHVEWFVKLGWLLITIFFLLTNCFNISFKIIQKKTSTSLHVIWSRQKIEQVFRSSFWHFSTMSYHFISVDFLSKCQQSCRQKVNKCFVLSSVCSLTLKWTISSVIDLVISLYLVWVRLKTNLSKSFSGFSSMVSYLSHKNTFTIMFNTWKM